MSNENKFSQLKDKLPSVETVKERVGIVARFIKQIATLLLVAGAFIGGFVIGARMHELGALNGKFGKDLKGASVVISGPCMIDGIDQISALGEDQVKVSSIDDKELIGIIRKTREIVRCDLSKVSIDTLPLLADFGKTPVGIPEIQKTEKKAGLQPSYKSLENKILLVSGSCRSQVDLKELPPFTDEKIDVTSVEQSKESEEVFVISGIRRSDKLALSCSSKAIKYSLTDGRDAVVAQVQAPLTYLNKIITVSSKCVPDSRISTPRSADGRKVAFYRLANSPVQVLEETIVDNRLVKLTGQIVDKKMKEAFGQMIICDSSVYPMTYAEAKDEEDVKLDSVNSKVEEKVDQTQVVPEETELKVDQKANEKKDSNKKDLIEKLEGN